MEIQKPDVPGGENPGPEKKSLVEKVKESSVYQNYKRLFIIGVVVVVIVLVVVVKMIVGHMAAPKLTLADAMKQQKQTAKDAPVAVKGFKVGRFNYEDTLNVLGTIKGSMELKLSFEIPGVISSINYKEGEHYEEGALLISMKQDDILLRLKRAQAAFNKAESQAKSVENEVAENEKLIKMGAIAQAAVDKKKLELDAAKFEAEAQRLEMKANEAYLEKCNLYAPTSGMLGELNIEEGESISASTLIGTHISTEFVYAEFGIVERDVQKITLGQKTKVFVDAYPDKTFEGVIENIAPQITGTSRTSTAKVRVENPEGLLIPGMFARVRILLYSKKDALVVPTDAVQGGEGEKFVYVIKQKQPEGGGGPAAVGPGDAIGAPIMVKAMQQVQAMMPQKQKEPQEQVEPQGQKAPQERSDKKDKKKPGAEKEVSKKIEEGVAEKRPITIGYTRPDYTQIDAGLTEGELVVMTGFERLEDGKKVRLVETQEAEL